MGLKFSNFGKAVVASAPTGTSGLSFTVQAGTGLLFPALAAGDYFYGIFKDASGNREVVQITARSTDALTIAVGGRGIDGTTARTWAAGDYFVAGLTTIALNEWSGNANLQSIGALTSAADQLPYFTGSGTAALTTLSAFIRTLLNDVDAPTARATTGAVGLTGNETIAGNKTLSGSSSFTGATTFATGPNAPTAAVDTNTTQLATTGFVLAQAGSATPLVNAASAVVGTSTRYSRADHVHPSNSIGVGQTWQDVSGSRVAGTSYPNSTGRPIMAIVALATSSGCTISYSIGGILGVGSSFYASGGTTCVSFVVPNGVFYYVANNAGTSVVSKWLELR